MIWNNTAAMMARHRRALDVIRSGKLACYRCGGSGIYAPFGTCFRCGGHGADPAQPKHPEKSKRLKRQREWASQFDERGERKESREAITEAICG